MKKNNKWLGKVTFVISAIMIAMLIMTNVAFAADVSGTYSYASLCATDYTYTSGQTGSVEVSGDTFTLKAKGTNATNGTLCSSAKPAVACTTTLTIIPNCDVKITATAGTGSKVTASGLNLGVETQVKGGTQVTFSVTASDGTEVNNTLKVTLTADDTNNYPSDCATYSILNGDGKTYYYLDEAIEAIPDGGTVVVGMSGTVYHSDHENGTKTINIPSNVTLLLPRVAGQTVITGATDNLPYANYTLWNADSRWQLYNSNNRYLLLTIPKGTMVNNNGRIITGGSIAAMDAYFNGGTLSQGTYAGHTHSDIVLNGTLNMGSNSVLSAIGYITGSGTINVNGQGVTGAAIYQPFVINDYRGGNYTVAASGKYGNIDYSINTGIDGEESIISPFLRYTMQNIQTTINLNSGNYMYRYCDMWASSTHNQTTTCVIGDSKVEGLIKLADGASVKAKYQNSNKVKHYDAFKNGNVDDGSRGGINGWGYDQVGRTKLEIIGGASLGDMILNVNVSGNNIPISMSSVTFPIPYNYDIYLKAKSGNIASYSIPYSMMLLPGASMTVETGAILNLGDGTNAIRFMVMDGLFDHTLNGETSKIGSAPTVTTKYENTTDYTYPKTGELQTAGLSGTAQLKLNGGKLVVNSGVMFGGLVQTDGSSESQVTFNGTSGCDIRIGIVGKNGLKHSSAGATTRTLPARLMNGIGTYVEMKSGGIYKGILDKDNVISGYSYVLYTDSGKNSVSYSEPQKTTCDNCATCQLKYGSEATRCVCNIFTDIPVDGMWYDYTLTIKEQSKDSDSEKEVVYYHLGDSESDGLYKENHPNNELPIVSYETLTDDIGVVIDGVEIETEGNKVNLDNITLEKNTIITICNHDWDEGVENEHADLYNEGRITYTCDLCQATKTTTIPCLAIAEVDGVRYESLAEALDAAPEGFTITVLQQPEAGVIFRKHVRVDLKACPEYEISVDAEKGYEKSELGENTGIWQVAQTGKFNIAATNMKAGDSLALYFYVQVSDLPAETANLKAVLSREGEVDTTIAFNQWTSYGEGAYYRFAYNGIAAKEMTNVVTVRIYDGDELISNPCSESVENYAVRLLKSISAQETVTTVNEKIRTTVVDMLNYGAECQNHFLKENAGKLANVQISNWQEFATQSVEYADDHTANPLYFFSPTVTAENSLIYTFYFYNIDPEATKAVVTYTNHYNKPKSADIEYRIKNTTYNGESLTLYAVDVEGLSVADGRQIITCNILNEDGTVLTTALGSVEDYAARAIVQMPEDKDVFLNLLKFVDSSYAYFRELEKK